MADAGDWNEFQNLYSSGQLEPALQWLKQHPSQTASFYYNQGTVLFRMGQFGQATAYLEKAHQLDPFNSAVEANLSLARGKLAGLIGENRVDPAGSWLDSVAPRLPTADLMSVVSVILIAAGLSLANRYRKNRMAQRTLMSAAGALSLGCLLLLFALGLVRSGTMTSPAAACLESQVVRSGPGDRFLELSRLETGAKVRLTGDTLSEEGNPTQVWRQVRYSPSAVGWVKASSLLLL